MVNDVEKVKEVFYDIQEEGYYTHGVGDDKIPEKITIDQGNNPLSYVGIHPILERSIKKLKVMGFEIIMHMSIATPTYVGSKFLEGNKKLLYVDVPKPTEMSVTLKKYGKPTSSGSTYYNYTPPAKVYSIYSIDIFIDPPAKVKPTKTTGDKIKNFLSFKKDSDDPIEVPIEKEKNPPVTTPPTTNTDTQRDSWDKPRSWSSPASTKTYMSVTPSLTPFSFTVHISDPTKKYMFKLYNHKSNVINRKLVKEREITSVNNLMNRVGIENGTYFWEIWCGGIIVKEGEIRFS